MTENNPPSEPAGAGASQNPTPSENFAEFSSSLNEGAPKTFVPRPPEPAEFPRGFWRRTDYLLRNPNRLADSLRADRDLWQISGIMLVISIVMAALYGAVMGATNLLQGAPMPMQYKLLLILVTAIKVPVLFLLTLLIVLPPLYVSNTFLSAQLSFRQMLTLLLGSTAIAVTVLASMATVALFFALTSTSYHFLKLLHVAFFAYAGITAIIFLRRTMDEVTVGRTRTSGGMFILWLLLYMFVGTQLAWVLRPFVGSPKEPFQVFRPRSGNFYQSVLHSMSRVGDARK
jgi:hypothetical protein